MLVISAAEAVYAAKFSPWAPNRIACISNSNFGIQGGSFIQIFVTNGDHHSLAYQRCYQDALFEICWLDANSIVCGSGDGCLCFWSLFESQNDIPTQVLKIHDAEIHSLDSLNNQIVTASWDGGIKILDGQSSTVVKQIAGDKKCLIYGSTWNKWEPPVFASCDSLGKISIRDSRMNSNTPQTTITGHYSEVLSCSWSNCMALYSCDTTGRMFVWDRRSPRQPITSFVGHERAVRKVLAINENDALSCGYDFTVNHWSGERLVNSWRHHSEFVYGIDFMPSERKVLDGAWDRRLHIYAI